MLNPKFNLKFDTITFIFAEGFVVSTSTWRKLVITFRKVCFFLYYGIADAKETLWDRAQYVVQLGLIWATTLWNNEEVMRQELYIDFKNEYNHCHTNDKEYSETFRLLRLLFRSVLYSQLPNSQIPSSLCL
jgi:hypothetical protein